MKVGTMSRKFSLQTVLEYRKVLEDKARQRHARALVRVREIEEEILLAERSLSDLCRSMEDRCGTGLSIQDLLWCEEGIQRQRELVARLEARRDELDRMARQRREELVHAAREARLLEKLKDRHEERCREELRCAERVAIDEIAARYAGGR